MSEAPQGGANHALVKRGLHFQFAGAEAANLQEERTRRIAELRGAIFGIFEGLTGMQEGINWAIFDVPPKNDLLNEDGDRMDREILIIVDRRVSTMVPDIRIISNELFMVGDRVDYLTEDFSLDSEHDAHLFVDATGVQEDGQHDEDSLSTTFFVKDDMLFVVNYADYTMSFGIDAEPGDSVEYVNPYGFVEFELDQLDALASASGLFAEAAYVTPTTYGVQPDLVTIG